jgi:hypothetical protein
MLYAAKCYWPGVTERELAQVSIRAGRAAGPIEAEDVLYVGSLLFTADDLVLCLFEGPSRAAVKRASDEAGIPCERVMDSVWLGPHGGAPAPQTTLRRRQRWDMLGTGGR